MSRVTHRGSARAAPTASPHVAAWVARSIAAAHSDLVAMVVPQMVQQLRSDSHGYARKLLVSASSKTAMTAHQVLWGLAAESEASPTVDGDGSRAPSDLRSDDVNQTNPSAGRQGGSGDDPSHGFQQQLAGKDPLPGAASRVAARILVSLGSAQRASFHVQYAFFDRVTDISRRLKEECSAKAERTKHIGTCLKQLFRRIKETRVDAVLGALDAIKRGDSESIGALDPDRTAGQRIVGAEGRGRASSLVGYITGTSGQTGGTQSRIAANGGVGVGGGGGGGSTSRGENTAPSRSWNALRQACEGSNPVSRREVLAFAWGAGGRREAVTKVTEAAAADAANQQLAVRSASDAGTAVRNLAVELEDQLITRYAGLGPEFEPLLYLPTGPGQRIVSVVMDSGRAMQSAAKCPFLLQFKVTPYAGSMLNESAAVAIDDVGVPSGGVSMRMRGTNRNPANAARLPASPLLGLASLATGASTRSVWQSVKSKGSFLMLKARNRMNTASAHISAGRTSAGRLVRSAMGAVRKRIGGAR